jgi:hypothetical protein
MSILKLRNIVVQKWSEKLRPLEGKRRKSERDKKKKKERKR